MMDSLGDRMKSYEAVVRHVLMPHSYTILRVDGRAFHTYLRDAKKPFDYDFMDCMERVGEALCGQISGVIYCYGQSDEISLALDDTAPQSQPWFGGVVQKMVSVAASIATLSLAHQRGTTHGPQFDARVFTVPNLGEVENYFIWRQQDAVRNSISMAAQAYFSHSQLHGLNTKVMQELLFAHHGVNWNDYPDRAKRGWVVERKRREAPVTYHHKGTGEKITTIVERTFWEAEPAPHFVYGSGFLSPTTWATNDEVLVGKVD